MLRTELSGLKRDNFELRSRLQRFELEPAAQSTQFQAAQFEQMRAQLQDYSVMEQELAQARRQGFTVRQQLQELQMKFTDATEQLAAADEAAAASKQQTLFKEKQILELNDNLDQLFEQNKTALQEQTEQFKQIIEENFALKGQLSVSEAQRTSQTARAENLEQQATFQQQDILQKQTELASIAVSQERLQALEGALEKLQQRDEKLQSENTVLKQRAEALQSETVGAVSAKLEAQEALKAAQKELDSEAMLRKQF